MTKSESIKLNQERKEFLLRQLKHWLNSSMIWEEGSDDYNYCLTHAIKISAELDKL